MAKNVWVRLPRKTSEIPHFLDPNLFRRGSGAISKNGAEAEDFCVAVRQLIDRQQMHFNWRHKQSPISA